MSIKSRVMSIMVIFGLSVPVAGQATESNIERLGQELAKGFVKGIGEKAEDFGGMGPEFGAKLGKFISGAIGSGAKDVGKAVNDGVDEILGGEALNKGLGKVLNNNLKTAVIKSLPVVALALAVVGGIGLSKHYLTLAVTKMFAEPRLETSKAEGSVTRFIKEKIFRMKPKYKSYRDMALNDATATNILKYLNAMKFASKKGKELPSLLLFGPPGTGKTEMAKRIAAEFNYNAIFLSGSSFLQFDGGKGVSILNEMFDMAESPAWNGRKTLIFIDEAESFLGKRGEGQSEKAEMLLTHFLSRTGTKSKEYSIVYATNRPNVLDDAMARRIAYHVEVALPEFKPRKELFKMYLGKVAEDKDIQVAEKLNEEFYTELAQHSKGLSGSDISEVAYIAQNQAYSNEMRLTHEIVFDAIIDVMKKYNKKSDYVSNATAK